MSIKNNYPKILLIAIGKINHKDSANNGMLIRNLLGGWPKSKLCQIYSSGANNDIGFFESYYQVGKADRRFGTLFDFFKKNQGPSGVIESSTCTSESKHTNLFKRVIKIFVDSGIHEILFSIRISKKMNEWIVLNNPDIILCQGYNISFASLPIKIKNKYNIPYIWYPTDDWPSTLYQENKIHIPVVSFIVRSIVESLVKGLVLNASVNIAFNHYMAHEYFQRWGQTFKILMQGDLISRFVCMASNNSDPSKLKIVAAGVFDSHRLPLLFDLDSACTLLHEDSIEATAYIYAVNESEINKRAFKNLIILKAPDHEGLPSNLMNSDILFLPERFDSSSKDIGLSISSKAHLYMYTNVPIIVYSDALTGISKYATEFRWALVVNNRNVLDLKNAILHLFKNRTIALEQSCAAIETAKKFHDIKSIRQEFEQIVTDAVSRNYS